MGAYEAGCTGDEDIIAFEGHLNEYMRFMEEKCPNSEVRRIILGYIFKVPCRHINGRSCRNQEKANENLLTIAS